MTHNAGPIVSVSATIPTEVVDDFLLVPQDDPDRPAVYVAGDLYTFLATTRETDFDFNFFDFFLPVGGGPPPHIHVLEDEVWHTIGGELQFNFGDQGTTSIVVPDGTTLFGPLNRTHGFKNLDSMVSVSGVTPGARTLSITAPGALELFFNAAATRVTGDRDAPIPGFNNSTGAGFIDPIKVAKFGARTDGSVVFDETKIANYKAPEDALEHVIVLPEDAEGEVVERAKELAKLDVFSIWTTGNQAGIPKRPMFTGPFGLEYTSLISLQESRNKLSYNQFSLEPQELASFDTLIQANLTDSQVVEPAESAATGVANIELNTEGGIDYSLSVTGLDFGELVEGGNSQTPNDDSDDVTAIHVHSGKRGANGDHVFSILDPDEKDENDLSITLNENGSATLSGTWNQTEKEIPKNLIDFFDGSIPGAESDFYFQIHTEGSPNGQIRGQIASTTDADNFPKSVKSDDHELFYVKEGQLSVKIGDEVRVAEKDNFVYVAPGNEYSIANFGDETVESLAVTVADQEAPNTANNELFPSPLNPRGGILPNELVLLGDEADFFTDSSAQEFESHRRIYGAEADDELFAIKEDRLFGEEGNDLLDASVGQGRNQLYSGEGKDEIVVNVEDRAFGGDGDDLLDASIGSGRNLLDGGDGDDILIAGSNDQLVGGDGDDILNIRRGSNNLLYGGSSADQFRIVNGRLPDAVEVQYPEDTPRFLLEGLLLPELVDTRNTIMDFELGVDKIYILGIKDIVSSFDDLELLPAFGDIGSTSIIATFTEDGVEKEISLANVSGIIFNELSASDFIFA
jgi:Ca2+-binding RTX toxin-like protein